MKELAQINENIKNPLDINVAFYDFII